jgi:hypothetical protein
MTITPIEDVAFDDATTFAMGEAFDRTCESIRIIGSSVPVREIIAKQIIDAAKNGERDPARLYEQALIIFGIVDLSKLLIRRRRSPHPSLRFGHACSVIMSPVPSTEPGFLLAWPGTGGDLFPLLS